MDAVIPSHQAQRNLPIRLSPSAIPLAVVTTPKTTDIGTLPITRGHKVLAHMQASPRCHRRTQLQGSGERRHMIPRPQQDPALSDPGHRSGYALHASDCRAVAPQQRNPADRVTSHNRQWVRRDDPFTDNIKSKRTGKLAPYRGHQSFPVSARIPAKTTAAQTTNKAGENITTQT